MNVDVATLQGLRERLVAEGAEEIDIFYRIVDSPIGALLLASTAGGLTRVAFGVEGLDAVLDSLATKISPRIVKAPQRLDDVAREIDEYFAGQRTEFDIAVDLRLTSGFRREVVSQLSQIPYGKTASYAAVAALTSSAKAVRAVGTACATNPIPIVIPCHRVVRSDGAIGNYLGGTEAKRVLLDLESSQPL